MLGKKGTQAAWQIGHPEGSQQSPRARIVGTRVGSSEWWLNSLLGDWSRQLYKKGGNPD
jgi:hypothetical protein